MANIRGIALELENVHAVRVRLRETGKLLKNTIPDADADSGVTPSMANLAINYEQLDPFCVKMSEDIPLTRGPTVNAIYDELKELYKNYANCTQGTEELLAERWEVKRCLGKIKELGTKMKWRRVTDSTLVADYLALITFKIHTIPTKAPQPRIFFIIRLRSVGFLEPLGL